MNQYNVSEPDGQAQQVIVRKQMRDTLKEADAQTSFVLMSIKEEKGGSKGSIASATSQGHSWQMGRMLLKAADSLLEQVDRAAIDGSSFLDNLLDMGGEDDDTEKT